MYDVYVLKSLINGRFYIGCTNNLARRLYEHNNGLSTYTKSTRPFKLVYQEEFSTLKFARRREKQLKGGQGRQWLKNKLN